MIGVVRPCQGHLLMHIPHLLFSLTAGHQRRMCTFVDLFVPLPNGAIVRNTHLMFFTIHLALSIGFLKTGGPNWLAGA